MEDGLGDTIRVSLTENPEYEIPVAQKLVQKFDHIDSGINIDGFTFNNLTYSPFEYNRRVSKEVVNLGDHHVPVVFADLSSKDHITPANFFGFGYTYSIQLDKWNLMDLAADFVYIGTHEIDFEIPGTLRLVQDYSTWKINKRQDSIPFLQWNELSELNAEATFFLDVDLNTTFDITQLSNYPNAILVAHCSNSHKTPLFRKFRLNLDKNSIKNPVVLRIDSSVEDQETFQLNVSSDLGIHFIDGFGDGIWITGKQSLQFINSTSFGILQATRTRISKTEYISCPSCGRTLFDLQETTAKIRARTSHLKGIKIGIMGCIVNGPGEMADADYGYVGTGPGKINLYKEKTVVKKNVAEEEAVQALIDLIREHGDWVD